MKQAASSTQHAARSTHLLLHHPWLLSGMHRHARMVLPLPEHCHRRSHARYRIVRNLLHCAEVVQRAIFLVLHSGDCLPLGLFDRRHL